MKTNSNPVAPNHSTHIGRQLSAEAADHLGMVCANPLIRFLRRNVHMYPLRGNAFVCPFRHGLGVFNRRSAADAENLPLIVAMEQEDIADGTANILAEREARNSAEKLISDK